MSMKPEEKDSMLRSLKHIRAKAKELKKNMLSERIKPKEAVLELEVDDPEMAAAEGDVGPDDHKALEDHLGNLEGEHQSPLHDAEEKRFAAEESQALEGDKPEEPKALELDPALMRKLFGKKGRK